MCLATPQVLYADYTASGRALSFIEDYVRSEVLPTYGNTHTLASKTGAYRPSNTQAPARSAHVLVSRASVQAGNPASSSPRPAG
jgi:hypothetical protein